MCELTPSGCLRNPLNCDVDIRVLHMDTSPDGSTVVSAAADETLRFWDMFGSPPSSKRGGKEVDHCIPGSLSSMHKLR